MGRAASSRPHRRRMSESDSGNPVLVEVLRGAVVESRHAGAIAVSDADGRLLLGVGDVQRPVFPRSAVKALQAIPLVESGAAEAFGLSDEELAIACASHSGDSVHIGTVRSLLAKAGLDESYLACGAHWPVSERASRALTQSGRPPQPVHNNCSGKHAGMLAACVQLGLDPHGYEHPDHEVQILIAEIISEICGIALQRNRMGIDGCSVPTWALPLGALARGFARLGTGERLPQARAHAAERLRRACFAAPVLVAGEGRFDAVMMAGLAPDVFSKGGAEGVHCAALPVLGLGIAVKIDGGAKRAAERALIEVLAVLLPLARDVLAGEFASEIFNWRGTNVGRIKASEALLHAVTQLDSARRPPARGAARRSLS